MPFEEAGHTYEAGDDEHDTPLDFFEPMAKALGGFDLDPSASPTSNLADRNVTKEEDGMSIDWTGDVWLNPPYSEVGEWMEYAKRQYRMGNCRSIVALVYARTGTRWFHNHARNAAVQCFVKGRLTFGDGEYSAPAPSMVLVWGEASHNDTLLNYLYEVGQVVRPNAEPDGHVQGTISGWNHTTDDLLTLNIDIDLDDVLEPQPNDKQQFSQQYWEYDDLRLVGRALRGQEPRDESERESRRILLNGIVFTLTGKQEHNVIL
jgi:phage N-6-adenine-methyltransferase